MEKTRYLLLKMGLGDWNARIALLFDIASSWQTANLIFERCVTGLLSPF